jgi:hypothetical protein
VRRLRVVSVLVLSLVLGSVAVSGQESKATAAGQFDGPAELPREYVKSALVDTPAPGKTVLVKNSDELKAALGQASCGDTIRLEAGSVFPGDFKFPAKACDDAHWIVLRTSAADGDLPPEGTRITPCSGGVGSLPGRPAFPCPTPKNVMAKVVANGKGSGPLSFLDGANHYRFVGLEIARESPGSVIYNLAFLPGGGVADHLVFDRVWMHGTAQDETTRGIALGGSRYVAVVDSYFSDFHCVAITGACVDAQAIMGGLGNRPMGPYKIVDNFLEGSAETILFGGGQATLTPADIEIRRNHMFKPRIWKSGEAGFVGGTSGKPFIVKNLFELKNAQRVLLDGNLLENTWGGFSQAGFAVLLTPKNQNNQCPLCRVTDVVIRFNRVSHMASGLQMGTGLSDAGGASSGGERYSIHDNIFDDIDGKTYGGFGAFAQVASYSPTLRAVHIIHNTAFPPVALFIVGVGVEREKIPNFVFADNLVSVGQNDFFSTGGGNTNCAFGAMQQGPTNLLKNCFADANAIHNVLVGSKGGWPQGNSYPGDAASIVEDFRGGDYRLCRVGKESKCKKAAAFAGKASDGKDPGADVDAVNRALAGVE